MAQRSVKKYIVITSIFEPTEAVKSFARQGGYQLIVVGDKKTPAHWQQDGCIYLSVEQQLELAPAFAQSIPFNHYGRKMLGYVYAMQQGAEVIIDTDDDNIPYAGWEFPPFESSFVASKPDLGWVNIYQHYTSKFIWPRGLPLRHIRDGREKLQWAAAKSPQKIGIWQGLADEDPDVDAIYRLTDNTPCIFDDKEPVVLSRGTVCPFNSQNTAIRRELFPLLFLPSFVTFRFTDILRGIVAQPILWKHGYHLGFTKATVVQKRNEHDYFKDYESEVPMYLHSEKSLKLVADSLSASSVSDNLREAYEALHKAGIVEQKELTVLTEWLALC